MTEAELAMEEKMRKKKEEEEAMWQEYMEQRKKQRAKEEEELRKLKERQVKRRAFRAEQEKRMMENKRKQEEQRLRELEEKKAKEAEAKRKRLEEAERKRQAMQDALKKEKSGPNFVIQKKEMGGFGASEIHKTKEQLEEEKKVALGFRIKDLAIEGLGMDKLKAKAEELWECIIKLESEKYDLEERMKRQDYNLKELKERQKQINRNKALKKGLDPEAFSGKYPPKLQVASKYERRLDRRTYDDKKGLFEGPKLQVASKYERRIDRRTYEDKKILFDGVRKIKIAPYVRGSNPSQILRIQPFAS